MNKRKAFWYGSEAVIFLLYLLFFTVLSSSFWFGLVGAIIIIVLGLLTRKALREVKVANK